jgi:hypothetical protein
MTEKWKDEKPTPVKLNRLIFVWYSNFCVYFFQRSKARLDNKDAPTNKLVTKIVERGAGHEQRGMQASLREEGREKKEEEGTTAQSKSQTEPLNE